MKNRRIFLCFILVMVLLLTSCASPAAVVEEEKKDLEEIPSQKIDLDGIISEADARRRAEQEVPLDSSYLEQFLVEDSSAKGLVSSSNKSRYNFTYNNYDITVSPAVAKQDVEDVFTAIKYAYGAYYYFGGDEAFDQAKADVLAELESYESLSRDELNAILKKHLDFCVDGHFSLGSAQDENHKYKYYYTNDLPLWEDENGYYTIIDMNKWYIQLPENEYVSVDKTISDSGEIVLALKQFCPVSVAHESDDITITRGEETSTVTVQWTLSEAYSRTAYASNCSTMISAGAIAYLSTRQLDPNAGTEFEAINEFTRATSDAAVYILDLRGNGGGRTLYAIDWFESFLGREKTEENPLHFVTSSRKTYLNYNNQAASGKESYDCEVIEGEFAENDRLLIVLTDDNIASSGEDFLMIAQSMENVLVIGSNSSGYELCGNPISIGSKNLHLQITMGTALKFYNNRENFDGIGLMPDIWVNPKTAFTSVANLLKTYGLASEEDIYDFLQQIGDSFWESEEGGVDRNYFVNGDKIQMISPYANVQGQYPKGGIQYGYEGYGSGGYDSEIGILINGELSDDFELLYNEDDLYYGEIVREGNGVLRLNPKKSGQVAFIIKHGESYSIFRWHTLNKMTVHKGTWPFETLDYFPLSYGHYREITDGTGAY